MKYLLQFGIIMAVSFAGELFHDFLPLPVPSSMFLISIMAFLFLPAAVGLVVAWPIMKAAILQYIAANVISLIACMAGTGFAAQLLLSRPSKKEVPKEASHDFSS